jgi:hypothetical protein
MSILCPARRGARSSRPFVTDRDWFARYSRARYRVRRWQPDDARCIHDLANANESGWVTFVLRDGRKYAEIHPFLYRRRRSGKSKARGWAQSILRTFDRDPLQCDGEARWADDGFAVLRVI